MPSLPVDCESRSVGAKARAVVHYQFDADHWEYREDTGTDVGIDCRIELTEDNQWTGDELYCQIKGRSKPDYSAKKDYISIQLKVSFINYALAQAYPCVILLVDTTTEDVFYLPIQEHFIENPFLFKKTQSTQQELRLRIPATNLLTGNDEELKALAKRRYVGGPAEDLHVAR